MNTVTVYPYSPPVKTVLFCTKGNINLFLCPEGTTLSDIEDLLKGEVPYLTKIVGTTVFALPLPSNFRDLNNQVGASSRVRSELDEFASMFLEAGLPA